MKFAKSLRTPFFIEYLQWLLLVMGAPYLVKLEVTFFIKKLNFIHQGFLPQFKISFTPEMPFAEHILLENVCQWLHIEKLKTTFHFLKKKEKKIND